MLASLCRRRRRLLVQLRQIQAGCRERQFQPISSDVLLSHGYSSLAVAGAPGDEPYRTTVVSYLFSRTFSQATAAARERGIRNAANADAVRALLRQYGFSDAVVTVMVRRFPKLLVLNPDRILRPKLDLFSSIGLRPHQIAAYPVNLGRSFNNHLVPCIQFLRGIFGTDRGICLAIAGTKRPLAPGLESKMRPAVAALRRLGLPEDALKKLLILKMDVLFCSPDRISQIFEGLKELGMGINEKCFIYGIAMMTSLRKETYLRKIALYQSFGVTEVELRMAVKKHPKILLYSEENIKKKLQFFVDVLKIESSDVMKRPVVIGYSLEKAIIPRCAVLSLLMREGKIEPDVKFFDALLGSSEVFLRKYVLRYAHDVPDVVKAYEGNITFEGFRVPVKPRGH